MKPSVTNVPRLRDNMKFFRLLFLLLFFSFYSACVSLSKFPSIAIVFVCSRYCNSRLNFFPILIILPSHTSLESFAYFIQYLTNIRRWLFCCRLCCHCKSMWINSWLQFIETVSIVIKSFLKCYHQIMQISSNCMRSEESQPRVQLKLSTKNTFQMKNTYFVAVVIEIANMGKKKRYVHSIALDHLIAL